MVYVNNETYLEHHGIKGQKWGIRRYQNPDGSLTEAGKKRYLNADGSYNERGKRFKAKQYQKQITDLEFQRAQNMAEYASLVQGIERNNHTLSKIKSGSKKVEKLLAYNKAAEKRISEIPNEYDSTRDKMIEILNRMNSDKDIVYRTYETDYMTGENRYYNAATGTGYKVRSSSRVKPNSSKWNNKQQYTNRPVRVYYYY